MPRGKRNFVRGIFFKHLKMLFCLHFYFGRGRMEVIVIMIDEKEYQQSLDYIKRYWPKITFNLPQDRGIHIGLPYKFVSANAELFRNDQFYWDTYFTVLGLVASKKVSLARGMVDNLLRLYRRFKIIPMRNKLFNLGISQPPFLTSMILEIFSQTKDEG